MPTCSFMTKHGRVTFETATRAKCRPHATSGTHRVGGDHRANKSPAAPRAAPAAPRAAPAAQVTVPRSTRTRRAPNRYTTM